MKKTFFYTSLILFLGFISCDNEEARTALGITISASDFSTEINENPEDATILGTITAFASDGSEITYEIDSEAETPAGALSIDSNTGELSVLDSSLFEYDDYQEINATVNAVSGVLIKSIFVNITLVEVLDADSDYDALVSILENNEETTLDWDIETDISTWTGVTVTDDRVTGLDVSNANLSVLPTDIYKLAEITSINLNSNSLTEIPDEIASLENLTFLDISSNSIESSLSNTICEAISFDGVNFIKDETAVCSE